MYCKSGLKNPEHTFVVLEEADGQKRGLAMNALLAEPLPKGATLSSY
jgi:hypothetical protein